VAHQGLVGGGADGIADRARIRGAVRDNGNAVDTQQRRTTILGGIEPLADCAELLAHEQKGKAPDEPASEKLVQVADHKGGEPFHGLERDVAGKAVGDDHVGFGAIDIATLDITDVIDARRHLLQDLRRGPRQVGTLGGFLAVGEDSHAWLRDVVDMLPVHTAHHAELHKVERLDLSVRTGVDEQRKSSRSRDQRGDGGAVDSRQVAQYRHRSRHHRSGISRADEGIGLAALDQINPNIDGRFWLGQQRLERGLVHPDHFGGMLDGQRKAIGIKLLEFAFDHTAITDQYDFDSEVACRQDRSLDRGLGGEIAAHRVQRNFHGRPLTRLLLGRRQFTTAISAAVPAHTMRQGGFTALRTLDRINRTQRIVRAALVALGS